MGSDSGLYFIISSSGDGLWMNRKKKHGVISSFIAITAIILFATTDVFAAAVTLDGIQGVVFVERGTNRIRAYSKMVLEDDDVLRPLEKSVIRLRYSHCVKEYKQRDRIVIKHEKARLCSKTSSKPGSKTNSKINTMMSLLDDELIPEAVSEKPVVSAQDGIKVVDTLHVSIPPELLVDIPANVALVTQNEHSLSSTF